VAAQQQIEKSVSAWLSLGWHYFLACKWQSMAFSSLFVFIGMLFYWLLISWGYGLILFPFFIGFLIVGPVLIVGYQNVGAKIHQGRRPKMKDFFLAIKSGSSGVWLLVFLLSFCYFIWLTDAIAVYSLYFGVEGITLDERLFTDPKLRSSLFYYLLYSSMAAFIFAVVGFVLGAFSIPLMLHQQLSFVPAIVLSVKTVKVNLLLSLKWALTLMLIMILTMLICLPLLIIALPVTAYASYVAYLSLLGARQL
jgi:uncharacterized membrane protein